MCDTNTTWMLSLLAVIVAINLIDSKIVYRAEVKPEDVNSLLPLTPKQALPLIFFDGHAGEENIIREFPMGFTQVEIKDGRLTSGTEFYTIPPSRQIFFCPYPDSEETEILVDVYEANLEPSQALQCQHEPEPIIRLLTDYKKRFCNKGGGLDGHLFEFIYKVRFGNDEDNEKMKIFSIYKFCYSYRSREVLYVKYKTVSAKLLSEELLFREREIKFEGDLISEYNGGHIDSNHHTELLDQLEEFPNYEFQKMLQPEYMALYSWRKSTYNYVNVELQHQKLKNLWNEIHEFINTNATETHQLPRTILTGVRRIPSDELPLEAENQIRNIWVTLIMDTNIEANYKGLAILMHNFIAEKSEDQRSSGTSSTSTNKLYIDNLCGQDLCVNSLKQKFDEAKGQVRCCKVTEDIKKLFYYSSDDWKPIDRVLEIRKITYEYDD